MVCPAPWTLWSHWICISWRSHSTKAENQPPAMELVGGGLGAMEPNTESPLMALSSPTPLTINLHRPLNFCINPPAAGPPQGSGAWARCCLSGPQRGCSGRVCSGSPALPGVPSICSHSAGLSCKQSLNNSHPATAAQRSTKGIFFFVQIITRCYNL